MQETTFNLNRQPVKLIKVKPTQISDGFHVAMTAAIEVDSSLMSDYEYFYVCRAIAKGAIKVIQYEAVSEDDEVLV